MKKLLSAALLISLILASPLAHAAVKNYQVTGEITALSADAITVKKGKENWEIARGAATVPATAKVSDKVTVYYSMTASSIEAKPAKGK